MASCFSRVPVMRLPTTDRAVLARVAAPAQQTRSSASPTVSMVSLGCPKNTVDGEVMLADMQKSGFQVIDNHEEADAVIINTCAFVEDAQSESLEAILQAARLKADSENKKIIITGCMAQRYADDLAEQLPEIDAVVGFENYASIPAHTHKLLSGHQPTSASEKVLVGSATPPFRSEVDRIRMTKAHTAYIRVAEGCDHACSFCAIPGFRGKFRSKAWDSILEEARALVKSGVKEINLIAEDTNQYGMDKKGAPGLAQLMRELSQIDGLHWIRILYAYPSYFSEDLIDEIATNPKVCKYIDMPLQHISNLTLMAMNRPPRKHTEDLLLKLRARIPGLALRTTFICGFPGETAEQHQELYEFCKKFKFERMGAFAYSAEEGTSAAALPTQVEADERDRRRDALVSLQQKIGEHWAKKLVGKEIQVLVDGPDEDGCIVGRTQHDAPDIDNQVLLSDSADASVPRLATGQMRTCLVTQNLTFDLVAHPTS